MAGARFDNWLLAGVLRRLITEGQPSWWEPDLLYVDHAVRVTDEERDALLRAGVELPVEDES